MSMYIAATFKELTRKRVFLVTLIVTLAFLILFAFGVHAMALMSERSGSSPAEWLLSSMVMMVLALFFAQFLTSFFVLFSAMGTVTGEQESGLLLAVAARPIPRWKLYLAKWLGHAVWIAVYGAVLYASISWIIHSQAGLPLLLDEFLRGLVLFLWMPLVLLSLTMLGSIYLPMLGNGICSALLYGFSLFCGLVEGIASYGNVPPSIEKFFFLIGLLIPTDSIYKRSLYEVMGGADWAGMSISDMGPFSVSAVPSNAFLLYTVVYAAIVLWLGCWAFSRKDL
ncbi:ABC transporter permease [Paenibacillus koleovorans]|uniref:ABC transporter permease n=1 Tax=Paenibacillus koleovorans TaxID=121608 RepID=UPI000FD8397B|nr:ABC transporter permease subunit [Paenibacillus koleovorans]